MLPRLLANAAVSACAAAVALVLVRPVAMRILLAETNSNWSTIFSFWDRLHGTLRLDVPQASVDIGIAG